MLIVVYQFFCVAVHVHDVEVEISETCSFAAENEGYIPEEESCKLIIQLRKKVLEITQRYYNHNVN